MVDTRYFISTPFLMSLLHNDRDIYAIDLYQHALMDDLMM